jgi:hypothetical protein
MAHSGPYLGHQRLDNSIVCIILRDSRSCCVLAFRYGTFRKVADGVHLQSRLEVLLALPKVRHSATNELATHPNEMRPLLVRARPLRAHLVEGGA